MYSDFNVWITLIIIAVVMGVVQGTCAYLVLLERKIAAWTQDRIGPNRVGPAGLLQPIADGLKFLFKEQIIPGKVDKIFYLVAPAIAMTAALWPSRWCRSAAPRRRRPMLRSEPSRAPGPTRRRRELYRAVDCRLAADRSGAGRTRQRPGVSAETG